MAMKSYCYSPLYGNSLSLSCDSIHIINPCAMCRTLPLPKDVQGFSKLSQDEWFKLIPFFAVVTAFLVIILTSLFTDPSKKWYAANDSRKDVFT